MKTVGVLYKGVDTPFNTVTDTPVDVDYVTVPASTTKTLGSTGGVGNMLRRVLIVPATTSPGVVQIKDGTGAAVTIFAGGTVADITPFVLELGLRSTVGALQLITGANVSAIAVGSFT